MIHNEWLSSLKTYLFGVVDTLQVKSCYVGTVKGFSNILFVACKDLALQVCTHRICFIPPAVVKKREK